MRILLLKSNGKAQVSGSARLGGISREPDPSRMAFRTIEEKAKPGVLDIITSDPFKQGEGHVYRGPIPGFEKMRAGSGALEFISPRGVSSAPKVLSRLWGGIRGLVKPSVKVVQSQVAPRLSGVAQTAGPKEVTGAAKVLPPTPTPTQVAEVSNRPRFSSPISGIEGKTAVATKMPPIPATEAAKRPPIVSAQQLPEKTVRMKTIPEEVRNLPEHRGVSPKLEANPRLRVAEEAEELKVEKLIAQEDLKRPPDPTGGALQSKFKQMSDLLSGTTPTSREAAVKQTMEQLSAERAAAGKPPFFKSLIELNKSISAFLKAGCEVCKNFPLHASQSHS